MLERVTNEAVLQLTLISTKNALSLLCIPVLSVDAWEPDSSNQLQCMLVLGEKRRMLFQ